jgi:uncharacterized protein YdeI (YjbR/CyaY-like superfamily)
MTDRKVLDVHSPQQWEEWLECNHDSVDDVSRIQRFSPRKPESAWSKSNVERVRRLVDDGRMRAPGERHVEAARADGRWLR